MCICLFVGRLFLHYSEHLAADCPHSSLLQIVCDSFSLTHLSLSACALLSTCKGILPKPHTYPFLCVRPEAVRKITFFLFYYCICLSLSHFGGESFSLSPFWVAFFSHILSREEQCSVILPSPVSLVSLSIPYKGRMQWHRISSVLKKKRL